MKRLNQGRRTRPDSPPPGQRMGWRRTALRLILPSVAAAVVAAVLLLPSPALNLASPSGGGPPSPLTAAIIDQLDATQPNPAFAEAATETLEATGYTVDYYPGEEVTVDFYRNLPQHNYDLILFRVHSTAVISRGEEAVSSVSLFTNEPYSESKYYDEQVAGNVGFASYYDDGPQVFGITAGFIESSMNGRFDKTVIIMMGCDGLKNDRAAQAFLNRGASSFISWSDFVLADHTDTATQRLLQHLLVEELPLSEAVARTNGEVGPDPVYGAELRYRPVE